MLKNSRILPCLALGSSLVFVLLLSRTYFVSYDGEGAASSPVRGERRRKNYPRFVSASARLNRSEIPGANDVEMDSGI
jgi:hypothetical protein